jgi:hypothetical protein
MTLYTNEQSTLELSMEIRKIWDQESGDGYKN